MWLVYVLALVVGGGLMLVQAVSGGHDAVDAGHALDVQHHGGGPGVLSIRSFIYGLFAFGFVGAALHIPRITGRTSALLIALARLGSAAASGAASLHEAAGRRARVLLPCAADRPGKIRLDLGGQQVDMKATTSGPPIPAGAEVVVVEVREDVALVAPVPLSGGTS
jgi:hypothetical protein